MGINIAIDGPAGAGKSTIAKKLAVKLNYIYVDTGAMYRAIALYLLRNSIEANDIENIKQSLNNVDITIQYSDVGQIVLLNGENVNNYIREEEVGKMASATSKYSCVREKLLSLQRTMAKSNNVIMDGRDIGTCVLPNATVKIYLTASSRKRAERRYKELVGKNIQCDLNIIEKDIIERDNQDMTREVAPLKQADDAIKVDSSELNIDEVVEFIYNIINDKINNVL